jgi:hypothetical protein
MNAVSLEEALQGAPDLFKTWMTVRDSKVRQAHKDAEKDYAEGIPLLEPFIVGGEEMMYPDDPNGSEWNTKNCRCTIGYIAPKEAVTGLKK